MEIFGDHFRVKAKSETEKRRAMDSRAVRWVALAAVLSFLVGRAALWGTGISCAGALMATLMERGRGNIYCLAPLLLGMVSLTWSGSGFVPEEGAVAAIGLLFFFLRKKSMSFSMRAGITALLWCGVNWLYRFARAESYLYGSLEIAGDLFFTLLFCYVFHQFFSILTASEKTALRPGERTLILSAVLTLAVGGIGVSSVFSFSFSAAKVAALFLTLCAGYRRGITEGILAGVASGGIIMLMEGSTPMVPGLFGICGLAAGCFQRQGRMLTGLVFGAAVVLVELLQGHQNLFFTGYEPLAAALLFVLLPATWMEKVGEAVPSCRVESEEGEWTGRRHAKKVLQKYGDTFQKLAYYCRTPGRANPAKETLALEFRSVARIMEQIGEELSSPAKPKTGKARYQLSVGSAVYARETGISGDSILWGDVGRGKYLLALSDGMGQGPRAAEESSLTVNSVSELLKAGFDPETALRMVNSILLLKSTDEVFSTLDMGLVDRDTGKLRLYKIGAAATFVKRDGQVKTIKAASLPLGIVERMPLECMEFRLRKGDRLIMVSDGITDAISEEEDPDWLPEAIGGIRSGEPQTMADLIINRAVEKRGLKEKDDMTVLVVAVQ